MKYYNGNTIKTRSGAWRSKAQLNAISREYARKAEAERLEEIDRLGLTELWKAQTVYKKTAHFLNAVRKAANSITCGDKLVECVCSACVYADYYGMGLAEKSALFFEPLIKAAGGYIMTDYSTCAAMQGELVNL